MSFRLKAKVALKVCADQVEVLIANPAQRTTEWTAESLHKYLLGLGLDYTLEEVQRLNDEMHARGIVEDIPE